MVSRVKSRCSCSVGSPNRRTCRGVSSASKSSALASEHNFCAASAFLLARRSIQSRQAQQVVGAYHEVGPGLRSFLSTVTAAPQPTHGFDPTKDLFHPLADSLAHTVARLASSPAVQTPNLHPILATDVRRNFSLTAG